MQHLTALHHPWQPAFLRTAIAAGVLASASLLPVAAHAATVDLVTNITLSDPNTPAQTFVPVKFNVEFANRTNTATNAKGSITFSDHLSTIALTSKATNAANCPSAAAFTPVPTGTTTGGEAMSAPFPQLNEQSCFYELTVTPTQAGTAYALTSTMATAAGDVEANPITNSSSNPFAVTRSSMQLQITKELVSGGDQYGAPAKFKVTYKNLSSSDLSLGATESHWIDWEGTLSPQIIPASSTLGNFLCSSDKGNQAICDAISHNQNVTSGTNVQLYSSNFTNQVMKANETITITYDRTYAAPVCGDADISNTNWWEMADNITPQWMGSPGKDTGNVMFTLKNPTPCKAIPLTWNSSKTLVGVQRGGAISPAAQILADGDQAIYDLTIDLTDSDNDAIINDSTIPTLSKTVPFNIYDFVSLSNGAVPLPFPAGSTLVQMEWISCTDGSGANCDSKFQAPKMVQTYDAQFTPSANQYVNVEIGKKVTLRLALGFKLAPTPTCMQQTDSLVNEVGFSVLKPADSGYMYTEIVPSGRQHKTGPLAILPNIPYCVNLTVNQSVTPTEVPTDTTPVTFTVNFANNSASHGPDAVDLVTGTTLLGSNFKASSASCTVSGSAQAPAGSVLGNISGPNNLFQIDIAQMARAAVVSCKITGTVQGTNSFDSTATIALKSNTGTMQGGAVGNLLDPFPADDKAYVNYRTPDANTTNAPTPVPSNTPWGLALLAALVGGLAWRQRAKVA